MFCVPNKMNKDIVSVKKRHLQINTHNWKFETTLF